MKLQKTNAMRQLERGGIPYTPHSYETADGAVDGVAVAQKTGRNPAQVYKTLCTQSAGGLYHIFCIPVDGELDLKRAAKAAGVKSITMLPLAQVTAVTGYVRGGVSPFAMKKQYPTFLDARAQTQSTILVSGGKVGLQIELAPQDLIKAAGAGWME